MIHEQARMSGLTKELLGEDYLHLELLGYDLHEDFDREQANIAVTIRDKQTGEKQVIEGSGVGLIDAFFHALLDAMSGEYPSLETITIDKFLVQAKVGSGAETSQGDALATVTIGISNSMGRHFEFEHESRSVTRSGIKATLTAAEYFVNAERAFVSAYKTLKNARETNRQDLVHQYTAVMAELVKNTSYSDVIEQIKADLDAE